MGMKLGYLGIETEKFSEWKQLIELLGFSFHQEKEIAYLRMDSKERRVIFLKGDAEDYVFCGLEVDSEQEFEQAIAQLKETGIEVSAGTEQGASIRAVEKYASFVDPAGHVVDIAYGCKEAATPFVSCLAESDFITGDQGMGHIAFFTNSRAQCEKFYIDVLGARLSDHIFQPIAGGELQSSFLHFNPRHHTFAFANVVDVPEELEQKLSSKKINHFMCQFSDLKDVVRAQNRLEQAGLPLFMTLGEHPNDHDVSFYCLTPSGFGWEIGAGAIEVDDESWEPQTYSELSTWGHQMQFLAN